MTNVYMTKQHNKNQREIKISMKEHKHVEHNSILSHSNKCSHIIYIDYLMAFDIMTLLKSAKETIFNPLSQQNEFDLYVDSFFSVGFLVFVSKKLIQIPSFCKVNTSNRVQDTHLVHMFQIIFIPHVIENAFWKT